MIEQHEKIIYKVCLIYQDDTETIADRYQDIVLNLWLAYPKFKGESKISTWIYRIALNTCISEIRKQQSRPETIPLSYDMSEFIGDNHSDMDQVRELYQLIGQLNKWERALILLWLDDKSYDEIATIVGISKANVGVRLMRIKDKLKKLKNS